MALLQGTITFLLTDVEGSTRLWEEQPQAMSRALADHDEAVSKSVAANGGVLVKSRGEGDSTFATFAAPTDAVRAALTLQQRLTVGAPRPGPLTARESEVAQLVAAGLTARRIAERLVVSPRTVDAHVEHIRNKLGLRTRAEIAAWVTARGHDHSEPVLRVRCALHTGEAELRAGDYFGQTVNRCARLRDAAHGGQVVLSGATENLTKQALPDGATVRDLGSHRLRDLLEAEHVFQLCHPDLIEDFPRLRSLDVLPTNLPTQLASFLGRDDEIANIQELLASKRLVTLTGAAGVGKTTLAIRVAAELLDRYPDGVWLVELAVLTDPELLAALVGSAMGIREDASLKDTAQERLIDYLRSRALLIVLDNCEHLTTKCAHLAEGVLRSCPDVTILSTSREPLGVAGERVWLVPSLSVPDKGSTEPEVLHEFSAVRLFVERAQQQTSSFRLTTENASAIAEVCTRLDGIPLALELAAARVPVLTPSEIAHRLQDQFKLLSRGTRTAREQRKTMRAAIDWSYDLLDADEKAVLARLSVFVGGFTLEAAESVCSVAGIDPELVLDLLDALVRKSLVVTQERGKTSRYNVLEMIRQYGEEKLISTGETDLIHGRHLEHFLAWTEEVATESERAGTLFRQTSPLLDERQNLRAALSWSEHLGRLDDVAKIAGSLFPVWLASDFSEAKRWLDLGVEAAGGLDDETKARLFTTRAWLATAASEAWLPLTFARRAIEACGGRPSFYAATAHALLAMMRSWEALAAGEDVSEEVAQLGRRAVELAPDANARKAALLFLGHARVNTRDFAGAIADFEEAERLSTEQIVWSPQSALSTLYHLVGNDEAALDAAERGRASTWDWGSPEWTFYFSLPYALADAARGHHKEALDFLCEEWDALGPVRVPGVVWAVVVMLGVLAALRQEWARAGVLLSAAGAYASGGGALRGPQDLALLLHYTPIVTDALGPAETQRQTEVGAAMSLDDAVRYGLEGPTER